MSDETSPTADSHSSISTKGPQMGEYTPGPWHVTGINKNLVYAERGFVADIHGDTRGSATATAQANAHLIAAAPTMLAALEPFADVDGEGDEDFPDDTKVTIQFGRSTAYGVTLGDFRRARAAIAKATGKP